MARKPLIVIADDERAARYGMLKALDREKYELIEAADGVEALDLISSRKPEIVILDINMPKMDGFQVLHKLQELNDVIKPLVIMITAQGSEKIAVESMKAGAYDYISKPYEIDELRLVVKRGLEKIGLIRENEHLRAELHAKHSFGEILGKSEPMLPIFEKIEKIAGANVAVLIQGESGTGKELVAREIHQRSLRKDAPFISMNCAALPETLIESELLGYEKGAFTGAVKERKGKFELAHLGTLFFDEIGDMSLNTQAKLLRVLEEKKFERLGGSRTIEVDVRIISATNRDLKKEIELGKFREDLYYRIKVVSIDLPPLKNRIGDIPLLIEKFTEKFAAKYQKHPFPIYEEATLSSLCRYAWPGNVRQLQNTIESLVLMCSADIIREHELPEELKESRNQFNIEELRRMSFKDAKNQIIQNFEREFILAKLEENSGNVTKTAEILGMHRQSLQQKIRDLGIKREIVLDSK
jgi:two-component system response regulator AtoC/two-component system nitrogen regulation response regulator NtrX